jgi:hypothetical protein
MNKTLNWKIQSYKRVTGRLDLESLGSWLTMPKNYPGTAGTTPMNEAIWAFWNLEILEKGRCVC